MAKTKAPQTPKAPKTSPATPAARAAAAAERVDATSQRHFARRPLKYDGTWYDRDQLIQLTGQPNDERLVRLGYVLAVESKDAKKLSTCNQCGGQFRTVGALEAHGELRHTERRNARPQMAPRQPGESDLDYDRRLEAFRRDVVAADDARDDRDERRLESEAPLHWENTSATRDAEL